ncbi:D-arabitol-phosphate dehydrogenase [Symmachiella dynata]|uniref:zinc-binding dehydrogenase n=1 Tax=Symmachiella dynata TaxID=2527995 RepID=UPI00118C0B29|nr:zinc-binding dehydrogenase [Symmachiella dynata]QDT49363.1 D-arabitol-phosphate dehydrogenase [Symmachiella dynata]
MKPTARAVTFHGPGRDLETIEFALPQLQEGEVLVKVSCSTLCGSDLHTYHGDRGTPCPTILGHEILGVVAELPADAAVLDHFGMPLEIGARVTWGIAASCGDCFFCRHELPQKCATLFKYGHQQITDAHPLSGGMAEYCHLAAGTPVFRVPESLPDTVACPANCATATVAAALRVAGQHSEGTLLIHGAGMLGLTAAAMARWQGYREVIVIDVNPQRLSRATEFGATHVVAAGETDSSLDDTVEATTAGRGVDVAIDVSGAPAAMRQGMEALRVGGCAVWVGAVFPTPPVEVIPEQVVRKMIEIRGLHNYAPRDLATALDFLNQTQSDYPFSGLIGDSYPLDDAEAAFAAAHESGAFRVMLRP